MLELFMYMERNMYKEKIVNIETGEETWRNYTEQEIMDVEKNQTEALAKEAAKAEAKAAKSALLEKLGITEEEAKLLLS